MTNDRPVIIRPSAFTLIELLVVISIISLLIAVLLPALQSARQAAQMSRSLSNARQITLSIHMYANDNKGILPPRSGMRINSAGNPSPDWPFWPYELTRMGYTATIDIFWSPARDMGDVDLTEMRNMTYSLNNNLYWQRVGYGANEYIMNYNIQPLRLGENGNPSDANTLLLCESWNMNSNYKSGFYFISPNYVGKTIVAAPFTYKKVAVATYVDGHANAGPAIDLKWDAVDDYNGSWLYVSYNTMRGRAPWYRAWQDGMF